MKIGDTVEFLGNEYTAVRYNGIPADFLPDEESDLQCKLCALEPNYCKKKVSIDDCHGITAFVFVNSIYVKAMSRI
jgi:hypothetical protein